MAGTPEVDVERWNGVFSRPKSPSWERIARRWLTDAYPDDVQATTIWPTWNLEVVAAELRLGEGATLADIGCGGGGPGMWVARRVGAHYIGVDPSPVARERARDRAESFLPPDRVRFVSGHFLETGLPDATADAIVAFDSFHFVQDRPAALAELARVARPGAHIAMAFALDRNRPDSDAVADGSIFTAAGLKPVRIDDTPDLRRRLEGYGRDMLAAAADLERELGSENAEEILAGPRATEQILAAFRHLLVVVERAH